MLKQHASNEENQELLPLLRLRVHYPESWEDVKVFLIILELLTVKSEVKFYLPCY